jgi:hypothetical protein
MGGAGAAVGQVGEPVGPHAPGSRVAHPRRPPRCPPARAPGPSPTGALAGAPVPESGGAAGSAATAESARHGAVQRATSDPACWARPGASQAWPPRAVPAPLDSSARAAPPLGAPGSRRAPSPGRALGGANRRGAPGRGAAASEQVSTQRRRHWRTMRSLVPTSWALCGLLPSGCSCASITSLGAHDQPLAGGRRPNQPPAECLASTSVTSMGVLGFPSTHQQHLHCRVYLSQLSSSNSEQIYDCLYLVGHSAINLRKGEKAGMLCVAGRDLHRRRAMK